MALAYKELTDPERAVWHAVANGALVELPLSAPAEDDPANGPTWGEDRRVRAQLIYELLTERTGPKDTPPRAIKLAGARITGALDLDATTLVCPLMLRRCSFEQPIRLSEAEAIAIRLPGCHVLDLNAEQLTTRGNLELDAGFNAKDVNLIGANIGGSINFEGAKLANPGKRVLYGEGAKVGGDLLCDGVDAQGQVHLLGANIGGTLSFQGAKLDNAGDTVLNANRLTVGQSMYCGNKFDAKGEINLIGANIGGSINFAGAKLANPGKSVLTADEVKVGRNLAFIEADVEGKVDLDGANIGGWLSFNNVKLANPGKSVLTAKGVKVGRNLNFFGASVKGEIDLEGANIGGALDFDWALLVNPEKIAVNLERASVTQNVLMRLASIDGELNLTAARVGRWHDAPDMWKQESLNLRLSGFVYETIEGKDAEGREFTAKDRLRLWLPKGNKYAPQPYEQLAAVYRREGNDQARTVEIGKQRARRDAVQGWARWPSRAWSALLRWTIGYGYRPALALIPLTVLLFAGTVIFAAAHPDQLHPAKTGPEQPGFNSFRYTLDLLLPVANFKQRDAFVASGWTAWLSFGFTFAGWLLAAVVVAGLGGVFRRD
jgi:hypothetical protein